MQAPLPENEAQRLDALQRYRILDTPPDQQLDDITLLAAHVCEAPIALITLVDSGRQWFKSKVGWADQETSRDISFCAHAILEPGKEMVVADASRDARFADNPLVTSDPPHIRFYSGVPLCTPEGYALGTLCVLDRVPRTLSVAQLGALRALARSVATELELRLSRSELRRSLETAAELAKELDQRVEQRYRKLVDASPDAIMIHSEGRIILVNRALVALLRARNADDLIGKESTFMLAPPFLEAARMRTRGLYAGEAQPRMEQTYLRLDGSPVDVEVASAPLVLDHKPAAQVTVRDITDRLRAQHTLQESERIQRNLAVELQKEKEKLVAAQSVAGVGSWETDLATLEVTWSPETHRIFETDAASFRPTHAAFLQFVHPDDRERVDQAFAQSLNSTVPFSVEHRVQLPDGRIKFVEERWRAFTGGQPKPVRAIGTCHDITERKRAELARDESENRFRLLWQTSTSAIVLMDRNSIIRYANPALLDVFGHEPAAATGKNLALLQPRHLAAGHLRGTQRYLESGQKTLDWRAVETIGLHKDGREFPVEIGFSVMEINGEPIFAGFIRDITERKQAEEARGTMEAKLRELQKLEAIGTLAGGIAHDFNNIIAIMLGNADLARRELDREHSAMQSIEEIVKAGRRGRDLVQQILSFSRRQAITMAPVALGSIVEEVARMLSANLPAQISIEVSIAANAPLVRADSTQMMQVLMNLGTNAIQAMRGRAGSLHMALEAITSTLLPTAEPGADQRAQPAARLVVRDSGPGMDQATLDRMFEPFFTTKPPGEGTGLGLSVVHGIVQSHGGLIKVSSTPGGGTCFTIDLPVASGAQAVSPPADAAPAVSAPAPAKAGAGRRILYLDDDDSLVFLVRRLLERDGFAVRAFSLQAEAIAAVAADTDAFDLVVTDFNMPGMNGIEVTQKLLAIKPALKVAIASGYVDDALTETARRAGVTKLIYKESAIEDFCAVIQQLINETT